MATQAPPSGRPLAIVTGASSGIGRQLAVIAAEEGFDLVIAADTSLDEVAEQVRALGAQTTVVQCDLATIEGVDDCHSSGSQSTGRSLAGQCGARIGTCIPRSGLCRRGARARYQHLGHALSGASDRQADARRAAAGRILFTGSIAGYMPGAYSAVYNGTKAFIDSFALALRNELQDTGVTVTCLMPGVTDTEFFERAGMMDTKVGTQDDKADPADVARIGFDAMMKGESDVVAGMKNKLQVAMAGIVPKEALAEQHRKMAQPGSAQ